MAALVARYRGQVFGLCYRMLGNWEDADDVTQESFVRVFRSLRHWDPTRDFKPWLLSIAGNRCRSVLATRKRRPPPKDMGDDVPDRTPDVHAVRHLAEEVELALSELRQEYRQAFVLFHAQELSYAEIAEVLGCPVGTVKTWVYRARRELAQILVRRGVVQESRYESG